MPPRKNSSAMRDLAEKNRISVDCIAPPFLASITSTAKSTRP